ncbi:MAG: SpoIID/LytB domain-containing protein [Chloroflexota bacterium]
MKLTCVFATALALFLGQATLSPLYAQEPAQTFRLISWSQDDQFFIGFTSGSVINTPDGRTVQTSELWQIPLDNAQPQNLGSGYDLVRNSQTGFLFFTSSLTKTVAYQKLDLQNGVLLQATRGEVQQAARLNQQRSDASGKRFVAPNGANQAVVINRFFEATLSFGQIGRPAEQILTYPGEIVSDVAWHPDGNQLAFIRTPLGSGTDQFSELWQYNLRSSQTRRLTTNQISDHSPIWHQDGQRLALVQENQIRIIVAKTGEIAREINLPHFISLEPNFEKPTPNQTPQVPPATIRVLHHESNTCRDVPVGQIDTIPFETYVKRVVPHEVFPSWPDETLKAQAVAARTYSWYFVNRNKNADYDVTDWVNFQYMCDETLARTDEAVEATTSEYLAYAGEVLLAFFSAENSSPTRNHATLPYIRAVNDPPSFGQTRNGHGYGLGQWGSQRWADEYQWSYQAILNHYYTGVTLEEGLPVSVAGPMTDTIAPNIAVTYPFANQYLNSNTLWLKANVSDENGTITQTNFYLNTVLTTTRLTHEAGPALAGGYLVDISAWPDQSLLTNSYVITAEAFDAAGNRAVSPAVKIGLDRVAPTGLLTTTTYPLGTVIFTETAKLTVTLFVSDSLDLNPQMSLGDGSWQVEAEDFETTLGYLVTDTMALNGQAYLATVADHQVGAWIVRRDSWMMADLAYSAFFRLKTSQVISAVNIQTATFSQTVASLQVFNATTGDLIGLKHLRLLDFQEPDKYQAFRVDFVYPNSVSGVEFELYFHDKVDLYFDRVIILEYPVKSPGLLPITYRDSRLKIVDEAGNISADLRMFFDLPPDTEMYLPLIAKSSG